MRKCFAHLYLCNFEFGIRFSHLEVISGTLKGPKLRVSVNFRSISGPLVILESWAYPYELPSTALCEVPRLSIPPYVVDISKRSMKEFAKYDVLYYFSSIFRIFSEKFSQNRSDVSTKSKRRLGGRQTRFWLEIECTLRCTCFLLLKSSERASILTILKGIGIT